MPVSLVLFYVMFILCFTTGKAHGCGTFPKCRTMLGYCLILGPIFLEFPAPWGLLKIAYKTRNQKTETFFLLSGAHTYLEHFNEVA
jgi:hypothetical protein